MKQNTINIKNHIYTISGDNFVKVVKKTQQTNLMLRQARLSIFNVEQLKRENKTKTEYNKIIRDVKTLLDGLGLYDYVKSIKEADLQTKVLEDIFGFYSERVAEECGIEIVFLSEENSYGVYLKRFIKNFCKYVNKPFLDNDQYQELCRILDIETDAQKDDCINYLSQKYPNFHTEFVKLKSEKGKSANKNRNSIILYTWKKVIGVVEDLTVDIKTSGDIYKKIKPFVNYITVRNFGIYRKSTKFISVTPDNSETILSYSKTKNTHIKNSQGKYGDHTERNVYRLREKKIDISVHSNCYKLIDNKRKERGISEFSNTFGPCDNHHPIPGKVDKDTSVSGKKELRKNPYNNCYALKAEHDYELHPLNNTKVVAYEPMVKALKSAYYSVKTIVDNFTEDKEIFDQYLKECENQMKSILFPSYSGPKSYIQLLESQEIELDHKNIVRI